MTNERVEMRPGDMDEFNNESRLILNIQDDGDIVVIIIQKRGNSIEKAEIEFCTPLSGGGKSPKTHAALVRLYETMKKENET